MFYVHGLNKYFKIYIYILKNQIDVIMGCIGQKTLEICPKSKKRLMEEIRSEILLKLNENVLFLAVIFAQRYKTHYMQLSKIFDI